MQSVLVAAGIYNLVWGSWVVFLPAAFFRWLNVPPLNYPLIWQCVGMIVGVYGIGYLLAAQAPLQHWPITLVGLLGKIFGPLGMWWAIRTGQLPAKCAWACLTNDILWWVPFGYILIRAWMQCRASGKYRDGVLIPQGDATGYGYHHGFNADRGATGQSIRPCAQHRCPPKIDGLDEGARHFRGYQGSHWHGARSDVGGD